MKALHNKALHQTGRGGVASFLRRRPVVEARPAGEGRCWTGTEVAPLYGWRQSWLHLRDASVGRHWRGLYDGDSSQNSCRLFEGAHRIG